MGCRLNSESYARYSGDMGKTAALKRCDVHHRDRIGSGGTPRAAERSRKVQNRDRSWNRLWETARTERGDYRQTWRVERTRASGFGGGVEKIVSQAGNRA